MAIKYKNETFQKKAHGYHMRFTKSMAYNLQLFLYLQLLLEVVANYMIS